jgi:hypothetical protein
VAAERLDFDDHFCPANDVVFAIVFGEDEMFRQLAQAVTGEQIDLLGKVYTQATLRERNVKLESIRFDTFAELKDKRIITLDMERSRSRKVRLRRRQVFYTARAISTQNVDDMAYEDLEPVNVVFVLTEPDYPYPIQEVGLLDRKTYELYDDLMNMTVVYVNTVIREYDKASELYIFARFFAISNREEAEQFVEEFGSIRLAEELIRVYNNAVANKSYLAELERSPYFQGRLNEAQLAFERDKAEQRGIAIGRNEGLELAAVNAIKMLGIMDPSVLAVISQVSVERAAELIRQYSQK